MSKVMYVGNGNYSCTYFKGDSHYEVDVDTEDCQTMHYCSSWDKVEDIMRKCHGFTDSMLRELKRKTGTL